MKRTMAWLRRSGRRRGMPSMPFRDIPPPGNVFCRWRRLLCQSQVWHDPPFRPRHKTNARLEKSVESTKDVCTIARILATMANGGRVASTVRRASGPPGRTWGSLGVSKSFPFVVIHRCGGQEPSEKVCGRRRSLFKPDYFAPRNQRGLQRGPSQA